MIAAASTRGTLRICWELLGVIYHYKDTVLDVCIWVASHKKKARKWHLQHDSSTKGAILWTRVPESDKADSLHSLATVPVISEGKAELSWHGTAGSDTSQGWRRLALTETNKRERRFQCRRRSPCRARWGFWVSSHSRFGVYARSVFRKAQLLVEEGGVGDREEI